MVILPGTSPLVSHLVQMHCKLIGALLEPMDRVLHLAHLRMADYKHNPNTSAFTVGAHFSMINSMNYLLCKVESSLS